MARARKEELAVDLDGESHRAGWEEAEDLRELREKGAVRDIS